MPSQILTALDGFGRLNTANSISRHYPVVVIIVACFLLCIDLEKLRNMFLIMAEDVPGFVLTEDLQFHIMELVREKIDRLKNMNSPLRPWLEIFYYGDKNEEEEMRVLLQSGGAEVNEAYDLYLRFNQDEELRQLEEARQQYLHDYNTSINYAKREGEAIGETRGEEKKAIAVAKNMVTVHGHRSYFFLAKGVLALPFWSIFTFCSFSAANLAAKDHERPHKSTHAKKT